MRIAAVASLLIGSSVLAAAPSGPPRRVAIVFGGNCGPYNLTGNMFQGDMAAETTALRQKGWTVQPLYGGNVERCTLLSTDPRCKPGADPVEPDAPVAPPAECCPAGITPNDPNWTGKYLSDAAGLPVNQMIPASKENLLYVMDYMKKYLPPGSELMISIATHGSPAIGGHAHGVCTSDGSILHMNDPELLKRLAHFKNSNVKLAVLDDSCFSGGAVKPLSAYGCVLSLQTSNRVGVQAELTRSVAEVATHTVVAPDQPSLQDVYQAVLEKNVNTGILNDPQITGFPELTTFNEATARVLIDHTLDYSAAVQWDKAVDKDRHMGCLTVDAQIKQLQNLLPAVAKILGDSSFRSGGGASPTGSNSLSLAFFNVQSGLAQIQGSLDQLVKLQAQHPQPIQQIGLLNASIAQQAANIQSDIMQMQLAAFEKNKDTTPAMKACKDFQL
jgi:hypothetical protein